MSLPERPGATPSFEQRNAYRQSPSRRFRPGDVEAGGYQSVMGQPHHQRGPSASSFAETIAAPNTNVERDPLSPTPDQQSMPEQPFQRKRSLIRPERNRIGKDHPNYHYRKHAANMNTLPSSTGNDPILEDLEGTTDLSGAGSRNGDANSDDSPPRRKLERAHTGQGEKNRVRQRVTSGGKPSRIQKEGPKREPKVVEQVRPPSFWNIYCAIITFWCPDFMLKCCGKRSCLLYTSPSPRD